MDHSAGSKKSDTKPGFFPGTNPDARNILRHQRSSLFQTTRYQCPNLRCIGDRRSEEDNLSRVSISMLYAEDEYVGEYTYTSTPNGQQLSEMAGLSSDVSCQIVVSDPTFHTHNVSTAASQLCSGVFIRQSLIVCVQVERWFLFLPYWADLGCKSNSKSSFFLSVETDRYGYDYGTTRYRTRAVGSFTAGDGTIYTSPNVVSRAFPFTYEP